MLRMITYVADHVQVLPGGGRSVWPHHLRAPNEEYIVRMLKIHQGNFHVFLEASSAYIVVGKIISLVGMVCIRVTLESEVSFLNLWLTMICRFA
jgi:hypothetical protein